MVVQVLLQICERALNLVVRIWHSLTVLALKGEEVRQIEIQAVHCRSQTPMRVMHLSVYMLALVICRILPLLLPHLVVFLEICLIALM